MLYKLLLTVSTTFMVPAKIHMFQHVKNLYKTNDSSNKQKLWFRDTKLDKIHSSVNLYENYLKLF